MTELKDGSVELVVTSPPYWHIKDYGVKGQVGYGQSLHQYLKDLYCVWRECHRALAPGRRLCINIGDQFARATVYGRYKVIPLHAEIIAQCEDIGFDYMGSIIWQKRTTMRTSGGATVMGSYPYPPNGLVEIDYEHIMLFKRPGKAPKVARSVKERSRLSKQEWKTDFNGHWHFGGARQVGHEAMFPEELPRRLISMFTFVGETVLDPFLGSGTTIKAALDLNRRAVGYEINRDFQEVIEKKIGPKAFKGISVTHQDQRATSSRTDYVPRIKDARPQRQHKERRDKDLLKVTRIVDHRTLELSDGSKVRFLGIRVHRKKEALAYLKEKVLKRQVQLKFDDNSGTRSEAYVYLKNRIFINSYMIRSGMASPDPRKDHPKKERFMALAKGKAKKKE
jgi:DNA modification methylase